MAIFYTDTGSLGILQVSGSALVSGSGSSILSVSGNSGGILSVSDYAPGDNVFEIVSASIDLFIIDANKNVSIANSLVVTGSITGSLFGTSSFSTSASFSLTASYALNGGGGGSSSGTSGTSGTSGSSGTAGSSGTSGTSGSSGTSGTRGSSGTSGTSGASISLTIADEGTAQGTATFLNFIGSAVTATVSSGTGSITITGGGSGTGFPYEGTAVITGSIVLTSGSGFPDLLAAEALTAGDFVNVYSGGVRKASNDDTTKQAHGFVTASYSTSDPVIVFYSGINPNISGLTAGSRYFLGTSGGETLTPPTNTGQISQEIGVAISTTAMLVNFGPAIIT